MTHGMTAFLLITAFQAAPAQVEITPERAEIEVTETAQLQVRALDGAGRPIEELAVRWIASTPELASVDQRGQVTGLNPGMAKITAVVAGQPASVSVVIRALPPAELRAELGTDAPYAGQVTPLVQQQRSSDCRGRRGRAGLRSLRGHRRDRGGRSRGPHDGHGIRAPRPGPHVRARAS
jgi:hypothetical protein